MKISTIRIKMNMVTLTRQSQFENVMKRKFTVHWQGWTANPFPNIEGQMHSKFSEAEDLTSDLIEMFEADEFDICTVVYNNFVSVITQVVTSQQIIPVDLVGLEQVSEEDEGLSTNEKPSAIYEYEPSEQEILTELLPSNLKIQVFRALLESSASEHGARMSAMDNATRNAGEMIDDLTLTFNRSRQARITSELIEIISGAEAL